MSRETKGPILQQTVSPILVNSSGLSAEPDFRIFSVSVKASPGTPAYKTPEEYYDEVLELRKQIGGMDKDNSLLRAKLRRVEEDNNKKEREIESLMDPTKVNKSRLSFALHNSLQLSKLSSEFSPK